MRLGISAPNSTGFDNKLNNCAAFLLSKQPNSVLSLLTLANQAENSAQSVLPVLGLLAYATYTHAHIS